MDKQGNKPTIETMINTAALALTSYGVITLTKEIEICPWETFIKGILLIMLGAGLEFFKYYGRNKEYW